MALLLVLAACAAVPEAERKLVAEVPDCARADEQIAALDALKPSKLEQGRTMIQNLAPPGWIAGAIHRDFADRRAIANGDYARRLDARIAEIRKTCG